MSSPTVTTSVMAANFSERWLVKLKNYLMYIGNNQKRFIFLNFCSQSHLYPSRHTNGHTGGDIKNKYRDRACAPL